LNCAPLISTEKPPFSRVVSAAPSGRFDRANPGHRTVSQFGRRVYYLNLIVRANRGSLRRDDPRRQRRPYGAVRSITRGHFGPKKDARGPSMASLRSEGTLGWWRRYDPFLQGLTPGSSAASNRSLVSDSAARLAGRTGCRYDHSRGPQRSVAISDIAGRLTATAV